MPVFAGTLSTIEADLQALLRLADEDMTTMALRWINLGYLDVVQKTECLQQSTSSNLTSGVSAFTLPASVLRVKKMTITYSDGTVSRPLAAIPLEKLLELRRMTVATGQLVTRPFYAYVAEADIELWPTPGSGQSLTIWHVYYPTALASASDTPAIREPWGSKLLLYAAAVEAARFKKDPLLGDYEGAYDYWLRRYLEHLNFSRDLSQFVYAGDDGWPAPHDPSSDWFTLAGPVV